MFGILLHGKKPKNLGYGFGDFWDDVKSTGTAIYEGYDYVTPDALQTEKYIESGYNFITEDAFDDDFWKRQGNRIKSDPVQYIKTELGNAIEGATPEWLQDVAVNIEKWVKDYVRDLIKSNYSNGIQQEAENGKVLIKEYNSYIPTPESIKKSVAEPVGTIAGSAAAAVFGPWASVVAGPLAYTFSYNLVDEMFQQFINQLKRELFPIEYEQVQERLRMANLTDEQLSAISYAEWNPGARYFTEFSQPVNSLSIPMKKEIVRLVDKFKPLLAMMNPDFTPAIEKIDDYVFYMLWAVDAYKEKLANQIFADQVLMFIAITIWNKRAQQLDETVKYGEGHSGQAFASRMASLSKAARDMKDVIGRWEASQARGAYEAKLAEDRKRWASEASSNAATATILQQQAKAEEIKEAKGKSKIGLATLGTIVASLMLS